MKTVLSPGYGCSVGTCFGTGVFSVRLVGAGVGTGALVTVTGFDVGVDVGSPVTVSDTFGVASGVTDGVGDSSGCAVGVVVFSGGTVGVCEGSGDGAGVGVEVTTGGTKGVNVGFTVGVGLGVGVSYSYLAIARTCTLPELFGTASSIALIVRRSGPDIISV